MAGSTYVRQVGPASQRCVVDVCPNQAARNSLMCPHHKRRTPARFDEVAAAACWDEGITPTTDPVSLRHTVTCASCPAPLFAGQPAFPTRQGWVHAASKDCYPELGASA